MEEGRRDLRVAIREHAWEGPGLVTAERPDGLPCLSGRSLWELLVQKLITSPAPTMVAQTEKHAIILLDLVFG